MLRHFITACFFVLASNHALGETLPTETFYNPTVAQSPAWQAISYTSTLQALPSLAPLAKTTKVPPAKKGSKPMVNKLVAVYSSGVKAQAKRKFTELYIGYPLVELQLGVPKNDLAGALTVYMGVNYLAFRGISLPQDQQLSFFQALYAQTRQVLLASRGFAKMKPAKKRTLFEQLAILGTFSASTGLELQSKPSPDITSGLALQDASRRNLEALLNISADRIAASPSGTLVIQ